MSSVRGQPVDDRIVWSEDHSNTGSRVTAPSDSSAIVPNIAHRIAFCITELDPGGAEKTLARIVTSLDRQVWDPEVFCLAPRGQVADKLEACDVPVVCLDARSRWDGRVLPRLVHELRRFRPALLQTFLFHANLTGRLAARLAGVPVVVSGVRVVEPDARWRHRVDAWTNSLVAHNICVSRGVAEVCQKSGIAAKKITVIPNGIDAAEVTRMPAVELEQFGVPRSAEVILAVGRLHPQKGFLVLLEAAEPLLKASDEVQLVIVGEGPQRSELSAWVRSHGLEHSVHLLGWRPDVAGLMKSADLFVLPSLWEGMPNTLLEAMAVGLPVVATSVEGVADIVTDGETGLLVPPRSAERLRSALRTLLAAKEIRRRMGGAAQGSVSEKFTMEAMCQTYDTVYRDLLAKNS